MASERHVKIRPGERIDEIAARVYGDVFRHEQLLTDNPEIVDIFYPVSEQLLVVTDD